MRRITKPDVNNEDPDYWERVLESHQLGIRQLGLQEPVADGSEENPEDEEEFLNE